MSTTRRYATELIRLLNAADRPIYVLDDELTIVFINRACQEWLAAAAEGLLGRRCIYHSSASAVGPTAVAAGLCPPPQVADGEIIVATVARLADDGQSIERLARFLPLGAGGADFLGVIALVEPTDQPEKKQPSAPDDQQPPEIEAIALHEHVRRFRHEAAARYRADRLIGRGPAMQLARQQIELAAASQASVLLVGPQGSGRQHLAAAIHYASGLEKGDSPRPTFGRCPPERPGGCFAQMGTVPFFQPLDCSLLGVDLLEALMAAIARGSALGEQAAAPCTLLLHRVDELSADVQAELAGLFARRSLAARLIATAAEPLVDLARRGKFRPDLAAALSTITIELPPLVHRRDDLPLLAQLFLEDCNAAAPRQIGGFTPAALDRLDACAWPGNLDELAQVVAESHRRAAGPEIDVGDLPQRLYWAAQAAAQPRRPEETIVLNEYLGQVERELIRRALAKAKGNKTRAARLLGMTRPRLYRRMVQLGLEEGAGEMD